ncbi:hypothetical protein D910_08113 [Dendroctonus ponderosae]
MHKISLLLALLSAVSAAKLDNLQYLPPQGNSIQAPSQQPGLAGPQSGVGQYQPSGQGPFGPHPQGPEPSGFLQQPSNQYGPPAGQGNQHLPGQQQYPEQRSPLNDVPIVRLDSENPGDGTYRYAYETGNDIAAQEEGSAQSGWNKAQGSYRFVSPEGQNFEISYTADENGYVPQGAHLPTPPPIPEAILKSLEVIRQAEASGNILEGAYQPEGDDGQYHEGHDEGQYNPNGGYQQPNGGYQQGGIDNSRNVPQGFSHQNADQQRYPAQQQQQQQNLDANGGYKY